MENIFRGRYFFDKMKRIISVVTAVAMIATLSTAPRLQDKAMERIKNSKRGTDPTRSSIRNLKI
jgi:Ni/Co efflux regulator RcnB